MAATPRVILIAGPNGAGKTTFAREFLPTDANCPVFVNTDLIAAGLAPFAPETVARQAGRIMLEEMARHFAARVSFAFESTLSGRDYSRLIEQWQAAGYWVKLIFLQLASPEEALPAWRSASGRAGMAFPKRMDVSIPTSFASCRAAASLRSKTRARSTGPMLKTIA